MADLIFKSPKPRDPSEVAPRTFRFVASTGTVDRDGDILEPGGWDLAAFLANPVILMGHDRTAPPVARASRVWVEGSRLMVEVQFPDAGVSESSDEAFALVRDGFLRALSVGFLPVGEPERLPSGGRRFRRQELLEVSLVSVPANAEALLAARVGGKVEAPRDLIRFDLESFKAPLTKAQQAEVLKAELPGLVRETARRLIRRKLYEATGRLDYLDA